VDVVVVVSCVRGDGDGGGEGGGNTGMCVGASTSNFLAAVHTLNTDGGSGMGDVG
jgi:hypothetical protein